MCMNDMYLYVPDKKICTTSVTDCSKTSVASMVKLYSPGGKSLIESVNEDALPNNRSSQLYNRIAENFRGRKLREFRGFGAISENFIRKNQRPQPLIIMSSPRKFSL